MENQHSHPTDEELLLQLDGEASPHAAKRIQAHLSGCWQCRCRRHDLELAITEFTRFHLQEFGSALPSPDGPSALLKAQLPGVSVERTARRFPWPAAFRQLTVPLTAAGIGIAVLAVVGLGVVLRRPANGAMVSHPDAKLTPGATVVADRQTICLSANVKNKAVSVAVRAKVFAEYGIRGAAHDFYEVDYLITPALGGADDIRNLWPHSYSAAWNAKVKDDLEDRLRDMVCGGQLDLAEAQRAMATDWIAAYRKYFHTSTPLPPH